MIYHQILTIRTLIIKVCYGFQHILATWCIHWLYPFFNKSVPKWVTISLTLFGLQYDVWTHYSHTWPL